MMNLFKTFDKIERCADISKQRVWLQMLVIFSIALFEALFIFFLIPFLEIFGQSTESAIAESSYTGQLLVDIFNKIGLPYNLYSLAT